MPATAVFRSLAVGTVAAVVVVGAYAWGRGNSASAASADQGNPVQTTSQDTTTSQDSGISVSGTGRVTGTPNLLRLQTSVEVTKPDVTSAMASANATMAAVQKKLKADGVAAADLQTSGLSVQPQYDYSTKTARLTGYQVTENLSVVLRDIAGAGAIIGDAAQVGGDQLRIGSATLDLDDDDSLVASARQKAFADALAKAQAYAKAAGRTLGAVTSISETDNSGAQIVRAPMKFAASSTNAADVPIQAGSQDVTVMVTATWAFG